MSKDPADLITILKEKSKSTPYQIESDGNASFTLKLNVVDSEYYTLMYKNGIKRAFAIEATIHADKQTVQTTDKLYAIDWRVGADPTDVKPVVNWSKQVQAGEIYQFETRKVVGLKDGKVGLAVNYKFNTAEAKRWLNNQLKAEGWKRVWGTQAKIGLVVGLIGGIGAVIVVIVLLAVLIFDPGYFQ